MCSGIYSAYTIHTWVQHWHRFCSHHSCTETSLDMMQKRYELNWMSEWRGNKKRTFKTSIIPQKAGALVNIVSDLKYIFDVKVNSNIKIDRKKPSIDRRLAPEPNEATSQILSCWYTKPCRPRYRALYPFLCRSLASAAWFEQGKCR